MNIAKVVLKEKVELFEEFLNCSGNGYKAWPNIRCVVFVSSKTPAGLIFAIPSSVRLEFVNPLKTKSLHRANANTEFKKRKQTHENKDQRKEKAFPVSLDQICDFIDQNLLIEVFLYAFFQI